MKQIGRVWEVAAHVLLAGAIIVFCYVAFVRSPPEPSGVTPGERFTELEGIVGKGRVTTVMLALTPTCPYCLRSMPFYAELVDMREEDGIRLKVVAAVDTSISVPLQRAQLRDLGVGVDTVVAVSFARMEIFGVPSLIVLDSAAVVHRVWRGLLDEAGEESVRQVIRN